LPPIRAAQDEQDRDRQYDQQQQEGSRQCQACQGIAQETCAAALGRRQEQQRQCNHSLQQR